MPDRMTQDEFRARLAKVCKALEDMKIVPKGSCERLQALPPTLLPAPVPGVPPPAAPPATFTPRAPEPGFDPQAPEPGRFDPGEPGAAQIPVVPTPPAAFDPVTLIPADQIPAVPEEPPPPGMSPPQDLPLTGPQLPTPASGKGSVLVYPQLWSQNTSGAGYFTGVRPGTYAYPSSIQVDGKGRIVSIVPGSAPETSDLCLTSYLVSTNEDGAPYTSIQDAYDAAVAAGHGIDNPAQVLVCPGDYTENVTMDTAGIDIIAIAPDKRQPSNAGTGRGITRLLGELEIQLGAESTLERTTAAWRGIDVVVTGVGQNGVDVGSLAAQYIHISDCRIDSDQFRALSFGGASSFLDIQRCEFNASGVFSTIDVSEGTFKMFASSVRAPSDSNTIAISADDGTLTIEQCTLLGKIVNDIATMVLIECFIQPNSSETASAGAGGSIAFLRSEINPAVGTSMFTGAGTFYHDAITYGANGAQPFGIATVQSREGIPQEQFFQQASGPFIVAGETAISAVGPNTVLLPLIARRPGPIYIKEDDTSTGPVTVTAIGGQTIRVGTATPVASITVPRPTGSSSGGVLLIANPTSTYWEAFYLGGAGAPCVTSYTVGAAAGRAQYTSIQAAYDAAKADGHDESDPAKVLVCPGVYTEDIGMDQAGIDIIAIAQDPYNELRGYESEGITRLVGNLSIDLDTSPPGIANNTCAWRGIDIDLASNPGSARQAIIFGGTDPQRAYISDCRIISRTDSNIIAGSNSGSGSVLDLIRCGVIQSQGPNGSPPTFIDWDDGTIELTDCSVFGRSTGDILDLELGAEFFATGCILTGNWDVAGDVVCRHCQITGSVDLTNASATFEITSCEMDSITGAGQLVTGSGEFIYDRLPWTGGTQGTFNTPGSGLTTTQLESIPDGANYDLLTQSSTYEITTESSVIMSTDGAGGTVTLPPATARTGPIRIKEIGSAAIGLTADPNGTDTINRGAAGAGVLVPVTGYTFVSDGISNWEIFD